MAPPDEDRESPDVSVTQTKINEAKSQAVTEEEVAFTTTLRQVHRLTLQDNNLLKAYRKIIEVESAEDDSDEPATKRQKDAISQLSDSEITIKNREDRCFGQLEKSLRERSSQNVAACSEWIRKARILSADPEVSAVSDEGNLGKP